MVMWVHWERHTSAISDRLKIRCRVGARENAVFMHRAKSFDDQVTRILFRLYFFFIFETWKNLENPGSDVFFSLFLAKKKISLTGITSIYTTSIYTSFSTQSNKILIYDNLPTAYTSIHHLASVFNVLIVPQYHKLSVSYLRTSWISCNYSCISKSWAVQGRTGRKQTVTYITYILYLSSLNVNI